VYLRLARPEGATHLRFDARALGVPPESRAVELGVRLISVGADGALGTAQQLANEWPPDPELSTAVGAVSAVQSFELPIDVSGRDLIVEVTTNAHLALDSMRFE
jgi:hypothetical protein